MTAEKSPKLARANRRDNGGTLVEYCIIITLIAAVAIAGLRFIGVDMNTKLNQMSDFLNSVNPGG